MRARRTFSQKFKRQVVESVLSGSVSQVELSLKYEVLPCLFQDGKENTNRARSFKNNMDITRFEFKLHKLKRVVGELIMENRMIRQVTELVEKEKKKSP